MYKIALAGILIVVSLLGLSRPSNAAITASFSLAGPNPYGGPCPVKLSFTGGIVGLSGTPVRYFFARFVNGSPIDGSPIDATIPASGTLALSRSLTIDMAHSGFQSYEVDVTAPVATQGKVYFAVTCGAVTMPIMHGLIPSVAAPMNVAATRDVDLCAKHINMLFCKAAIDHADQPLVWDWAGNPSYPTLDGYKVYRVDRGHNDLVETTSAGDGVHGTFIGAMGLANGRCFVVIGYVGSHESARSAQACVSP